MACSVIANIYSTEKAAQVYVVRDSRFPLTHVKQFVATSSTERLD